MNRKLQFFSLAIFSLFLVNLTNAQSTSESLAISSFHDRQHCRFLHHGLDVPWSENGTVEVLYKHGHGLSFFCTNAEDFKSLSETLRYLPFTRTHILYCGDSPITGDACLMGTCTYWFSLVPDNSDTADFLGMNESTSTNFLPCLLYTSPSPRDATLSRMPSSA